MYWPSVDAMLAQRRRRWANIEPALGHCIMLIGSQREQLVRCCVLGLSTSPLRASLRSGVNEYRWNINVYVNNKIPNTVTVAGLPGGGVT